MTSAAADRRSPTRPFAALAIGIGMMTPVATTAQPHTPRVMTAHRLDPGEAVRVDGTLDEPVWETAPSYAEWVQKEPEEGSPAINDTRVWFLYDADALYVGAINYDEDPTTIARNMARRDAAYAGRSDYFEIMLDPNGDQLTGYRFRVTAGGVQTDRYLYEDDQEDAAWDAVYESKVTIDERGWIVEMRIPLSQIRYETADTIQTWGVQFGRRRAADNELTRFSFVSKLRQGRVSQFGRVTGLHLIETPRRLEVLPYVVSRTHRGPAEVGDPFFDGMALDGRVGANLSYGLGTAFTLDATINPDFGQVEADPAVVNLTAFETFFQERRPFFVEDARVFDFKLSGGRNSLFYSRRVGRAPHGGDDGGADFTREPAATSILGAAKLTGRTPGGLSIGALVALTQEERGDGYFSGQNAFRKYQVEPRSTYGVVRLQRDFSQGRSRIGGIVTAVGRALPDDGTFDYLPSHAYSAGLDFEHTWADRTWALWGFFSASHVRGNTRAITAIQRASNHYLQRPDLNWGEFDSTATSLGGREWRLQFERRVGRWTGALWAAEISDGFEVNDLGFSTSPERLEGGAQIAYQEVRPNPVFRNWRVSFQTFHHFSHEALRDLWSTDRWGRAHTAGMFSLGGHAQLLNFWTIGIGVSYTPDGMSLTATRGGPRMADPGSVGFSVGVGSDNRKLLSAQPSLEITRGRDGSGHSLGVGLGLILQPSTQLLVSVTPSYDRISEGEQYVLATDAVPFTPTFGTRYLFAGLERQDVSMVTRVNLTFTPRLSLELFAQPLLSSGDYVTYQQLARPETFEFDVLEEGTVGPGPTCVGGRTCEAPDHTRYVDFDADGTPDFTFTDRDFNLRSWRSTAVLRWEYHPGSTLFLVWQRNQVDRATVGNFDFGRDVDALLSAPSDDILILKVNMWLTR